MAVHSTAILEGDVQLGEGVEIGPYVVIRGPVTIGAGTVVEERASIIGTTEIGCKNRICCGAIVGGDPQDLSYDGSMSYLKVGDGNTIREYVTIHRGAKEGSSTIVGNDNLFMALSHVGHDCLIHNEIVLANGSLLAGHVELFDRAIVSGQVAVHQFARVGRCAMAAGLTRVSRDIPPFMTGIGDSGLSGLNVVGLRRAGISSASRQALQDAFRVIFRSTLSREEALAQLESDPGAPEVTEVIRFIRESSRGIANYRRRSNLSGGEDEER